ncbi:MAG TPA: gluconate 2-dehydrogenase subunit 3 family protein [Saprospiraceae bacterium]|nr:gluconate 2-dehydrogenase subunit 3 family protein [Saprospiraceae bacterium]
MERREALKYTAIFMGTAMSASTIAAIAAGCSVDKTETWKPVFFTPEEDHFLSELAETMLPKTKTPGARDAMVDRFLDTVRPLRYTVEENTTFKTELKALMEKAKTDLGKDFTKASPEKRLEWLKGVDQAAYDSIKDKPDLHAEEKPYYLKLKEQILGAYFSSEIVSKEYFSFDPIPGKYQGCIPYTEIGHAWALS